MRCIENSETQRCVKKWYTYHWGTSQTLHHWGGASQTLHHWGDQSSQTLHHWGGQSNLASLGGPVKPCITGDQSNLASLGGPVKPCITGGASQTLHHWGPVKPCITGGASQTLHHWGVSQTLHHWGGGGGGGDCYVHISVTVNVSSNLFSISGNKMFYDYEKKKVCGTGYEDTDIQTQIFSFFLLGAEEVYFMVQAKEQLS